MFELDGCINVATHNLNAAINLKRLGLETSGRLSSSDLLCSILEPATSSLHTTPEVIYVSKKVVAVLDFILLQTSHNTHYFPIF
jgi:hypothetical protein